MDELLDYIQRLENDSFVCWSEDEKDAYLTACGSIKAKINEIMSDRSKRQALSERIFSIDMREDMREILKRRFKK